MRRVIPLLTTAPPDGGATTLAQQLDARVRPGSLVQPLPGGAVRKPDSLFMEARRPKA